jgi:hypothetical protein
MINEFKVRSVSFDDEKSVQEIEAQLLKEHEEKNGISSEETPVETTVVASDGTIEKESVEETPGTTPRELEDTDVLTYLKNRYNKEINSVDELFSARKEAEELPEDVSAFLKFKKDTGRGFEDFVKINKDYDTIPANDLLVEYLKQTNPDLDDEDIKFEVETRYAYDAEYDDAKEVKSKQIAMKKDLAKAKEYFNKQKEQYKIPLESREGFVPENEKGNYEAFKKYSKETEEMQKQQMERSEFFAKKTEEVFNDKFKGFEFNVGEGDVSFKPSNPEQMKKAQSDVSQFIGSFLDENGFIKNAEAYHKSIAVAMNPDSFAKFFYEQGKASAIDQVSKESKNIQMDIRQTPQPTATGGFKVTALDSDHGSGLRIKTRN